MTMIPVVPARKVLGHPRVFLRSAGVLWAGLVLSILAFDARSQDLDANGFSGPDSVEGTLEATADRQSEGALERYQAWKEGLSDRTGFSFGFDDQVQFLNTNSDRSPSNGLGNVLRFYGTWTMVNRGTPNDGGLVFKVENRSAMGDHISPQALGPSLGYAGLLSTTFSDAGWILSNLYWQQRLLDGRLAFVIGQVDVTDYVDVNNLASPWTSFGNLAFETPTIPAPGQGLGAAVQWRFDEHWAVLGGIANANGDAAEPVDSAQALFESGETFKHLAIGWSPDWADRYDQAIQLTVWQVDDRVEAGVEGGQGVALAASFRSGNWRPFFRAGYSDGGGAPLDRSVSLGTGYDVRDGQDLAGLALNWGRAPGSSLNQYTIELFYRYDPTDFIQITPSIQFVANPAYDPATDDMLVLGLRARLVF